MKNAKMISVDLTRKKIDIVPMKDDLTRDYIGGEGTGTRPLREMVRAQQFPGMVPVEDIWRLRDISYNIMEKMSTQLS